MMETYKRPDPDSLLQAMKENEKAMQGRLKIFFGMAAGVGKTYAMLEAAQHLVRERADVVIGYIETHGRIETEELVKGIEYVPRKKINYHGVRIEDLDIDAVLDRKPGIALIDELAHTNVEGFRHEKRYQDVIELLDNGISVFTTLNIQHVESMAALAEKITGVKIRETLPDSILDMADEIELIDIPPEELLKRLSEGKVYVPEKAELAAERFFKKENISALREMALHYVARLVDYNLHDYTQKRNIKGPWKSGERLLVAVSPSPYSEYLIRWTRRMAFNLKAPWVALYIEKQKLLDEASHNNLIKNLNLARELGANVISTADDDIVSGVLRIAEQQNITQIVVGKPLRRYAIDFFKGGNLVERLLKSSGDIEIHIVTQPDVHGKPPKMFTPFSPLHKIKEYGAAIASVVGMTLINYWLAPYTGYWSIALLYLLAISLLGIFLERGPVFFAAMVSALLWNFLFIPPMYTFRIVKIEDALMFGMYFVIALILGSLTTRLRSKERALRVRETRISALYELSKALGNAAGLDEVIHVGINYLEEYFNAKVAVLLTDDSSQLVSTPHTASSLTITDKEYGVAEWSFKNKKPAGLGTDTLSKSDAQYIPLIAPGKIVGVLVVRPIANMKFSPEQDNYLQNISYHLSMRIERENLSQSNQKALLVEESERLYKVLLNSISHELRTPLTAITGASSSLLDDAVDARPETRRALSYEIRTASDRLNRLVDNLLDMSRLESGMLTLNKQLYDIGDLISIVLRRLENELASHSVRVAVDDRLPMVDIDFSLMEQVFVNLIFNSVLHAQSATTISIMASVAEGMINITVRDNGTGLDEKDIPYIFDKFRRGSKAFSGGTGLGLSICKGIVEAHGGRINAGNSPGGGAEFIVSLPIREHQYKQEDLP